ncbi:MAG: DMT family transporter [Limnobacter sp.]|nr:DMT family transporter [Limnobacter sp.]
MVGFNWGVTVGEVIRVVLLFYLMPVWTLLLAWWVLGEVPHRRALLRVVAALAGAMLVLSPQDSMGFPVPATLGEWLGLSGGVCFALNNVMLRHQQARSAQARLFAMLWAGDLTCGGGCCAGFVGWGQ